MQITHGLPALLDQGPRYGHRLRAERLHDWFDEPVSRAGRPRRKELAIELAIEAEARHACRDVVAPAPTAVPLPVRAPQHDHAADRAVATEAAPNGGLTRGKNR